MQGVDGIGGPDRGLETTTRIGSSGAYQGGLRVRVERGRREEEPVRSGWRAPTVRREAEE
jgi:hypothetical protein